ncbi:DeoR/GlpR family DNA-binding transcription regulator [Cohnella thermotolerans]|jgi:DeoR/GlpR family transcriptional regulator of sugar metabolism|uniref:DeoR/GlpR family DNA-binding transcription regulator n=1 Tax=Cohnella thermotolerans TaxID=329858 RepID=UPI00041169CE|nr:DeoR/GlpR family DNA-binding transcription regulator [Cohnella thermotolerans]
MSLSFEERKTLILERLAEEGKLHVPVMAELLNVSTETIRRDLDRLDKEGKLKKVHGGAVKARSDAWELPFEQKALVNRQEKQAIAKLAASLVEDGDSILIGNGTTPLELIRHLKGKRHVTVITHSVPVMLLAMEAFEGRLIFIGGEVDMVQKSAEGPLAEWTLQHLKANKAFISAGGVSTVDGITDYDLDEANMSRKLMERSEELIVLADHTKMGKTTFAHICPLRNVSVVVSDKGCPTEWRQKLAAQEIELLLADVDDI